MVHEFFASYAAKMLVSLLKGKKPLTQCRLTHTRVRSVHIDILDTTIHRMLFGSEFSAPKTIIEFDRRLGKTQDKALIRDQAHRATLIGGLRPYC